MIFLGWFAFSVLDFKLLPFAPVIVFVSDLVLLAPLPKAYNEHSKIALDCPEPVLSARLYHKLLVCLWSINLSIDFKICTVVQKMKQLITHIV